MKLRIPIIRTRLVGAGLLAVAIFMSVEQKNLAAQPPTDPAHAAHVAAAANQAGGQTVDAQLAELRARVQQLEAIIQQQPGQSPPAGTMPMGAGNRPMPGMGSGATPAPGGTAGMDMTGGGQGGMGGDPVVANQLAELHAKMQRLEATIQQQFGSMSGATPMNGTRGMASGTKPMKGKMAGMSGMGAGNAPSGGAPEAMNPAGGMGGMGSGGASPPGGEMGMMAMRMDKMMGMMEKMKGGMGGGAMPAGAPMGGTAPGGGGGSMQPGQGAPAAGGMGGMGGGASPPGVDAGMMARMDKMIGIMDRMVGMMDRMTGGMGGGSMQPAQGMPAASGTGMMEDDMGEMSPTQPGQAAPPMGGDM